MSAAPSIALARNRDFRIFMSAETVAAIGDAVIVTALPLIVLDLTGSGLALGILGALQVLPDLIVGVFAGVVADRADRRRLMIGANLGRAALASLIPISIATNGPTLLIVMLVAAPISTLRTFFLASHAAAIAAIAGRDRLASATSVNEVLYSMGFVIGPAIAGILLAVSGAGITVSVIVLAYVLAMLAISLIRTDLRPPPTPRQVDVLGEARAGLDFIRRHVVLRSLVPFWAAISITTAGFVAALTVHVTRDLDRSSAELGLLLATYGLGSIGAAVIVHRLRAGSPRVLLLGGCLLQAAALILAGVTGNGPLLGIVALLAGLGSSTVLISYLTVRTAASPDTMLGRIGATARVLSLGLQPIGTMAAGIAIDLSDGSTTLVAMGLLLAGVGGLGVRSGGLRVATFRSGSTTHAALPAAAEPAELAAASADLQ
jgi:predicted MFS family arabinose efflux permease